MNPEIVRVVSIVISSIFVVGHLLGNVSHLSMGVATSIILSGFSLAEIIELKREL